MGSSTENSGQQNVNQSSESKKEKLYHILLENPIVVENSLSLEQPIQIVLNEKKKPQGFFTNLNPGEWIALFALSMSLMTAYFSYHQFAKQEQHTIDHDKLSVKPLLQPDLEYSIGSQWVGISIINKGIGPAIILNYKKLYANDPVENWQDLIDYIVQDSLKYWKSQEPYWDELDSLEVIAPNDEHKLLYSKTNNITNFNGAMGVLEKIKIIVNYQDIYSDSFSDTFDLSKF